MTGLLRAWFSTHSPLREDEKRLILAVKQIDYWQRYALEECRKSQAIVTAWLVAMEMPEVDLRDDIQGLLRSIDDQIAVLSEEIV